VRHWLNDLKNLPHSKALFPYKLSLDECKNYNFNLKQHYFKPMVDLQQSANAQKIKYEKALKNQF
jgi:deoxyribodipyrimidine photo-lyase